MGWWWRIAKRSSKFIKSAFGQKWLFGKFGKRDKSGTTLHEPTNAVGRSGSNGSTSAPSNSTHRMDEEYVLPDYNVPADENGVMYYPRATSPTSRVLQKSPQRNETYSNPAASNSSHKLNFTMPGFRKKQSAPPNIGTVLTLNEPKWLANWKI